MTTKVLITGSSGFVGGHILSALTKRSGFDISLLLRDPSRMKSEALEGVKVYKGDITRPETIKGVLTSKEIVIHCAALMSNYDDMPRDRFYEVNVIGTRNLLASCDLTTLKQFVHVSTAGVYGSTDNMPAGEGAPYGSMLSKYEWSKKEAEELLLEFSSKNRIPFTILRPSQLYGSGMRYGWPDTIKSIQDGTMLMPGGGSAKIHPLDIEDFTKSVNLVVGNSAAIGKTYNVAGPEVLSIKEVFGAIASILSVNPPRSIPYGVVLAVSLILEAMPGRFKSTKIKLLTPHRVRFFAEDHVYNISKANIELGYRPSVSVKDGFSEMINWYKGKWIL